MTDPRSLTLFKPGETFGEKRLLRPMEECRAMMRQPGARSAVQREATQRRAELAPPTTAQIAVTVETLQTIYGSDKRDEAGQRLMVGVWLELLADMPAAVMRDAVLEWARKDTPFMPRPGEFLTSCERIKQTREALASKAEVLATIELDPEPPAKAEITPEVRAAIAEGLRNMFKGAK